MFPPPPSTGCVEHDPGPAIDDIGHIRSELGSLTVDGDLPYVFSSDLTALTPGTLYYIRAYATNEIGTVYGSQQTFTTLQDPVVSTQAAGDIGTTSATGNGVLRIWVFPGRRSTGFAGVSNPPRPSTTPTTARRMKVPLRAPARLYHR